MKDNSVRQTPIKELDPKLTQILLMLLREHRQQLVLEIESNPSAVIEFQTTFPTEFDPVKQLNEVNELIKYLGKE